MPCEEERAIALTSFLTGHHLRLILKPVFLGIHRATARLMGSFPPWV